MFEALDSLWAGLMEDFYTCFIEKNRWKYLTSGLQNTILITFFALLIGVVIGIVISIVRSTYAKNYQEMKPGFGKKMLAVVNWFCGVYLTVIRGTPVVVQLMIIYYCVFVSSSNGILIGAVSFGINSGAYVAEIFRSGIMSIDNGQFEAGRSLGFNYVQTLRYIVLPQAFKNVLPSLANEFIVLLKETSVAGYVAVRDLTKGGDIIRGATYQTFMPLLAVAAIYLILVMFFTKLVNILERRLRTGER